MTCPWCKPDGRKKLTEEQVAEIRAGRRAGKKLKPLAKRFGVSEQQICRIVLGWQWK